MKSARPNDTGQAGAIVIGGDFQGLGVVRSLARHGVRVYLLDTGFCIGRFSRYVAKFARCPGAGDEDALLRFLEDLAQREHLEGWVLYPNSDDTVRFLARNRERLEERYRVTTPAWEVARLACDKQLTHEVAIRCGIPVPLTAYPEGVEELEEIEIGFPVILKPTEKEPFFSATGKKAIRADNRGQLVAEYARAMDLTSGASSIMVQELIAGGSRNLYSVGSLSRDGELLARVVARRPRQHPMDFGQATTFAETVDIPELEESAGKILGAIGYHGLSEVEFMFDDEDGKYKLIEINARPWGWHTLAIAAGVDLPYLSFRDMLGEKIRQNGFAKDAKWVRLLTDTPTVVREVAKGRMRPRDYFGSLRGKKQFAVLSLRDPAPFIAELMMLPYLWKKRGF
jgi:predicted ATP-grasp superfamily ATP-dependent carboligase